MQNVQNGGFCPKCGKPHAAGAAFCANCGARFNVAPPPPPPQPQYVAPPQPQPQYVQPQPQPQYVPQPQPQYVAPQPQPQYAPQPQPQYVAPQPQPQYTNTQSVPAVKPQKKLWKTICSIMLLVAVLIVMVLPFAGFYEYSYRAEGDVDSDLKDMIEETNEETEPVSIMDMFTEDEYSIIEAFENFGDTMEYIDMMADYASNDTVLAATMDAIFALAVHVIVFVMTVIFLITLLIYSIKAIIAMTKGQYENLVKNALAALARAMGTFLSFTIYTNMHVTYYDDETIIRGGICMSSLTAVAIYGAFALILGAMVVALIMNKDIALSPAKRANTIKSITAFVGLSAIAFVMLSQKAQYLFVATYRVFYPNAFDAEDAFLKFILVLGTLLIYATVATKITNDIQTAGREGLYFANLTPNEIASGDMKRGGEPNILANAIFFLFITVAVYIYESEFEFFILNPTALIILTVISVVVYIAYKVLASVFKNKAQPQPEAPAQSNVYYVNQQ